MLHHGTLRKYTAALLDFFNGIEIQYDDSNGNTLVRSVPIKYATREKCRVLDQYTGEQLASGNYNVLPRANLSLSVMAKAEQRIMNKNNKINKKSTENIYEYSYNSIPYEFTYELAFQCRGMNEAAQIIEQIAPKFNPTVNIDIWDAQNLNEPTRVAVKLLDIGIESPEYDEFSSNIFTVSIGLSLIGSLYQPIKSIDRIKEFRMNINENYDTGYSRKIIDNWDVDDGGNLIIPGTSTQIEGSAQHPPVIVDIVPTSPLVVGSINPLTVIWDDVDNVVSEMTFNWGLIQGTGVILGNLDTANIDITVGGTFEPQVTITDPYGNFATMSKVLVATPWLPSIAMISYSSGETIPLTGFNVLIGTYNATDSTVTSLSGRWVTDDLTFPITDLGAGLWNASGGNPTMEVAQNLEITITTADGDTFTETYTSITPHENAPNSWTQSAGTSGPGSIVRIATDGNRLVLGARRAGHYSLDANNPTDIILDAVNPSLWSGAVYDGTNFIKHTYNNQVDSPATRQAVSADGQTWVESIVSEITTSENWISLCDNPYNSNIHGITSTKVWKRINGTWQVITGTINNGGMRHIVEGPNEAIAVGQNSWVRWTNTVDYVDHNKSQLPGGENISNVTYGNGIWIITPQVAGKIYRSTDGGMTFSTILVPGLADMQFGAVTFDGTKFVLIDQSRWVWVSSDLGLTWTQGEQIPNTPYTVNTWAGIWAHNAGYIASGNDGGGNQRIVYSLGV